jgi:hypothetical protein
MLKEVPPVTFPPWNSPFEMSRNAYFSKIFSLRSFLSFPFFQQASRDFIVLLVLSLVKNASFAGHWWLTLVFLTTLEAEISRITVQGQPRHMVQEMPLHFQK